MDSSLMTSGFAQDNSSDTARPSDQGDGSGGGAPVDANDGSNAALVQQQNQQNQLLQQQFQQQQQQPMNNMFMGNASLQQAMSGFGAGADASNNLFGMNMGQNYLMQPPQQQQQQQQQQQPQQPQQQFQVPQQQQQQLFAGGFPQGLTPQMFGSPAPMMGQQQTQAPTGNGTELDQGGNQGNAQQQLAPNQLPQFQQNGAAMPNFQQLQQLMMAQQLFSQGGANGAGGMSMPGGAAPNFSAAASLFPLANNPLMGNLMGQTPQFMGATAGPTGTGGMWQGLAQPQMTAQPQQLMNQGGNAAAMNFFLSGLTGNNPNAAPAAVPQQQAPLVQQQQQAQSQQPPQAVAAQPLSAEGKMTSEEWAEPFFGKGKKEPPFPLKLHQILGNPEFAECISWNAHGRSWRILKPPVFEQIVIPLYFRHAKYASFMRQVNGWGFKRIVSGNDHNSYFHECFVRENPQMCLKMKRIKKKASSSKAKKGDGDSDDDESKAASEDEASHEKVTMQQPPPTLTTTSTIVTSASVPSVGGAGGAPTHQPFQQMDMMNAQSPALFAAALQNMQGGGGAAAGASAFQNPAFPGLNPSLPMNGLPSSTDSQWMMAAGMLGGNSGSTNAAGLMASTASLNNGNPQALAFGTSQADSTGQPAPANGQAGTGLSALGDLSHLDPSLLAKIQAALQHPQPQQQVQQPLGQAAVADTNATTSVEQGSNNNTSSSGAPRATSNANDDDAGDDDNDNDDEDDDESGEFDEDGSSDSEV